MRANSICQLAELSGYPIPTVQQMTKRGVLPRGDVPMGRLTYYSEELSAQIVRWLKEEYQPYKRGQQFKEGV